MLFSWKLFSHGNIGCSHVIGTHWDALDILLVIFAKGCLLMCIQIIQLHAWRRVRRKGNRISARTQYKAAPCFVIFMALPSQLPKIILAHFVIIIDLFTICFNNQRICCTYSKIIRPLNQIQKFICVLIRILRFS